MASASATAPASSSTTATTNNNPFRDLALAQQQQEALAAAAAEPLRFAWLKQDKAGWLPLRKRDNAALEAVLAASDEAPPPSSSSSCVLVEGGRYEVDVAARTLRAVYWDKDTRKVMRASWFSKPATNLPGGGGFVPYDEEDAAAIEALYQGVLDETVRSLAAGSFWGDPADGAGGGDGLGISSSSSCSTSSSSKNVLLRKELVLADKAHKVVLTVKALSPKQQQHRRSSSTASACPGDLGLAALPGIELELLQQRVSFGIGVLHNRVLRRGYVGESLPVPVPPPTTSADGAPPAAVHGEDEEEDDDMDREADHLVFVVHGIGEKLWSSGDFQGMLSLRSSVEQLRTNVLAQQVRHMEGECCTSKAAHPPSQEEEAKEAPAQEPSETAAATPDVAASNTTSTKTKKKKMRTEFVPIEWFDAVRSADSQDDLMRRIQRVTLPTVPMFRNLANDCVLDILLYMNPRYRQKIVEAVATRINAAYATFCQHNPGFAGKKVSLVGHSLGSVILFDLLAHQQGHENDPVLSPLDAHITYPQLTFPVDVFLTLGSPIGMFLCVREQELPPTFRFPTVARFYNVFHPFDPIAYRLEPLLQPAMAQLDPALVPYHEGPGGKTFVTKAREQTRRVSGSLSALSLSVSSGAKSLLGSLSSLAAAKPAFALGGHSEMMALATHTAPLGAAVEDEEAAEATPDVGALKINNGQRVDYVLQEHFSEQINEYVSSIAAHSCYFASPDVAYFLTKLVYHLDEEASGEEGEAVMEGMAMCM